MSLSIDPGNRGDSIQETDRDMNNIKIVNLANPTDNEDAENMMYFDKKNRKICLSKYADRSRFIETFIKKEHAGITQTTTQTVKYIIKINLSLLSINQD